ncbi:MAG: hypothetical protein L3J23_08405 [Flavobacteriaceae bacterium]|nr:hypothetical protein [Flavobacteriaceae bacterium]
MTTETFDIEKFEKNKVDGEYYFTLEDSTTVRQIESENEYIEYIMPSKPNLLEIYKQYYKSGEIQRYIISFPKDFLVLKKNYDKTGKLIEEIDYDKPFKFTFEQLVALLKKEKDTIDLYDKFTSITRGVVKEGIFWEVEYKIQKNRVEEITIDGITGEILERNFHLHLDN